jgi:hypothetical protein
MIFPDISLFIANERSKAEAFKSPDVFLFELTDVLSAIATGRTLLSEELSEEGLCLLPVLLVDTVLYLWRIDLTLYQTRVKQRLEVLGDR